MKMVFILSFQGTPKYHLEISSFTNDLNLYIKMGKFINFQEHDVESGNYASHSFMLIPGGTLERIVKHDF